MKILNLYAGLGGNRMGWIGHEVVAVEMDPQISDVYRSNNPLDALIIDDAHEYLRTNFQNFDLVWTSPPCQSHSRMIRGGRNRSPRFPNMKLYEEILFLQHNSGGLWVVENVVPYYLPLVPPTAQVGRHLFWSNFPIGEIKEPKAPSGFIKMQNLQQMRVLQDWLGIHYDKPIYYSDNHCASQVLRNCVHPEIGAQILEYAEIAQLTGQRT